MGCCQSKEEEYDSHGEERGPLLGEQGNAVPSYGAEQPGLGAAEGGHASKVTRQSAMDGIVQKTVDGILDVSTKSSDKVPKADVDVGERYRQYNVCIKKLKAPLPRRSPDDLGSFGGTNKSALAATVQAARASEEDNHQQLHNMMRNMLTSSVIAVAHKESLVMSYGEAP